MSQNAYIHGEGFVQRGRLSCTACQYADMSNNLTLMGVDMSEIWHWGSVQIYLISNKVHLQKQIWETCQKSDISERKKNVSANWFYTSLRYTDISCHIHDKTRYCHDMTHRHAYTYFQILLVLATRSQYEMYNGLTCITHANKSPMWMIRIVMYANIQVRYVACLTFWRPRDSIMLSPCEWLSC